MIYTVTLNPALDYYMGVEKVEAEVVTRATNDQKVPGGKGINVSRVLKRFGHESCALGFIGGFTGEYINDFLEKEQIDTKFVRVKGDTRINVKLKAELEYELNGVSPVISPDDIARLEAILNELTAGDVLVLAGSVPDTVHRSIYQQICKEAKAKDVEVYVDSSGSAMKEVVAAMPTFIKPNHHELAEMIGESVKTPEQAMPYVRTLVEGGISYVLVSFAEHGAVLGTKETLLVASAPKGDVRNSVGAGDSVVAGFLTAKQEGKANEDAFRFAVAAGSATAFSRGFCTREEVERLTEHIDISEC